VQELVEDGFTGEPVVVRSIDMRYAGQNYEREISLPPGPFTAESVTEMVARFSKAHDEFYGFSLEGEPVEFVTLRVSAIGPSDLADVIQPPPVGEITEPVTLRLVAFRGWGYLDTPVYRRSTLPAGTLLAGPAIIEETDSTTVVHPGDDVLVREDGLLELRVANL
jgi:N-methylhydantoinase A